ncbi:MAG: DUF1232 domain-containing protein [Saprospiraceae bacterium]
MKKDLSLKSSTLSSLQKKIRHLSTSLMYVALLMYYAFRRSETPPWAKRVVMGAFVYLFAPLDAIPDLTPLLGFTDDMGVMFYGLVLIAAYINEDVRQAARVKLASWVGTVDEETLKHIDDRL